MEASEDSSIQKSYTTISGINTSPMTITPRDTSLSAWRLYGQLKSGVTGLLHFSLMEVNVKLASEHFGGCEGKGMIAFCKQFAWELINSDYIKREAAEPCSSAHWCKEMDHILISLPCGKIFFGAEMVVSKSSYP